MGIKDSLTLRFTALMIVLLTVELNLVMLFDSTPIVGMILVAQVVAVIGFAASFIKEEDRERPILRATDRIRNEELDWTARKNCA